MCLFLGPEIGGVSSKELVCRKVATCMFTPSELKAFSKPARPGKEKGSVEGAHRARLANGVMLIIQQDATYFVCCKLADGDGDEIKVHFFNGSGGLYQTRRYRPVYVDSKDEKEIFTRTPKATYQAFTSFVKVATVVARDFSLTKQYTVPAKVWKTLPELKPRPLPPPSISDEADEKKASAAEDIEQPESNLQISDYELSCLDNIKANNQELERLGFWGPDVRGRGGGHRGGGRRGHKSGVSSTAPVRTSARLQRG